MQISPAQEMKRVKRNIDSLASPLMHGRGATFKGDSIAATFIASQFRGAGIKSFNESFLQPFHYNINTFPGTVKLKIGNKVLTTGKDFILDPSCKEGSFNGYIYWLDTIIVNNPEKIKKFLGADISNKAVVFQINFLEKIKKNSSEIVSKIAQAGAIIEVTDKKLTASLSPEQGLHPHFIVKKSSVKKWKGKVAFEVDAERVENYLSSNVIGFVPAKIPTDSFIVLSAHYDHLGRMGKGTYFPGANDNGSGTSMLLEFMHFFSDTANRTRYNVAFMAFGAEEAGLIGSRFYTEHPLFPLSKIKFMVNMDLMGTGDDGMMVVNGSIHEKYFHLLQKINDEKNYLPAIKKRGKAANSDHYFFSEKGVPAFFFYTLGGIAAYHDIYDIPETLPLTKYTEVFSLIRDFIYEIK